LSYLCDHSRKQIGKFLFVLTPTDGEYIIKKATRKGRINLIDYNVRESNKDIKEEMENKMQGHFHKMESVLQETWEKHRWMLEEYKKAAEEHRAQEQEHWKKEQDLLGSLAERVDALERKINWETTLVGETSTEQA